MCKRSDDHKRSDVNPHPSAVADAAEEGVAAAAIDAGADAWIDGDTACGRG